MLKVETLKFIEDLSINNNKEWFTKNKTRYEVAREDFIRFVDEVTMQIALFDSSIAKDIDGSKHIFRINRDLRFTKDKTPYKNYFGALIVPGGNKNKKLLPGYYVRIQSNGFFLAGGMHEPESIVVENIRNYISKNMDKFEKLIQSKSFKSHFGNFDNENSLKRVSAAFNEVKDESGLLKLKSFHVVKDFDMSEITKNKFLSKLSIYLKEIGKLNSLLNKAIK